jgi:hypothetical protein
MRNFYQNLLPFSKATNFLSLVWATEPLLAAIGLVWTKYGIATGLKKWEFSLTDGLGTHYWFLQ